MRVLGVVGSPRKGGNTDILVDKVLLGAQEKGNTTNKIFLNDLNIKPCQACMSCKKTGRRSQFVGFFLKPVFAAGAIVFLGLILISSFFISIHRPFPVFSESVKGHIKFLQGNLPAGITAHKPKEVGEWLRAKLDFKIMVPDLSSQGVNLSGARIYSLKDRQAAYLGYEKNGHAISVFMFDAQGLKFPKAKKVAVNNKIFYLTKERGYNSALWLEQEIACVFVSDLAEAELLYLASL